MSLILPPAAFLCELLFLEDFDCINDEAGQCHAGDTHEKACRAFFDFEVNAESFAHIPENFGQWVGEICGEKNTNNDGGKSLSDACAQCCPPRHAAKKA